MNYKKALAIGTILFGLGSLAYTKNYEKGMKTALENKHNIDMIGNFCEAEERNIEDVMKNLNEKVDRKKCGIGYFTIKNVPGLSKATGASGEADVKTNTIHMEDNYASTSKADSLFIPLGYKGLLGHEIFHLIYHNHTDKEEIFSRFFEFDNPDLFNNSDDFDSNEDLEEMLKVLPDTEGLPVSEVEGLPGVPPMPKGYVPKNPNIPKTIPKGYVSFYPLSGVDDAIDEDVACTGSYWINNGNYADKDEKVQEKVKVMRKECGK